MSNIKRLLLLPHIKVHNANALSSPFTIGFPAMTAWLGAIHALQRKLNSQGCVSIKFNSVAVISHQCDLQTHKGVDDFVYSIIGTGNPLDKTGARSAFIEEARCHLDVSLVLEYTGIEKDDEPILQEKIIHLLNSTMKMAGGDILNVKEPQFFKIEEGNSKDLNNLTRKLMPGYAIIERRDLMTEAMIAGQDAMDALLDNLVIHHHCEKRADETSEEKVVWTSKRKNKGWLVPIATGFHGLTELGEAKNQRDPNTPHRFAESVVTLGEFKMPHSIKSIDEILWRYQTDQTNNLYLCAQTQKIIQTEQEIEDSYYA
ncbi:type I-F CRISPR-associated protein Csy2 [Vibrio aphrogenes]|uniref:type I-F CRISPR-associated protein Csy2 n=1 Tax=Vibrio aphrogenes TaxID=1891186 RepID=UPI000F7EC4C2|nr:type I-F CRISPR-associated protein Csy2 [Vibrio aphrogenes]